MKTPSASGFLGKQLWSKPVETQPRPAQLEQPEALHPSPVAYHGFSQQSNQELPAEFRCKDSFT